MKNLPKPKKNILKIGQHFWSGGSKFLYFLKISRLNFHLVHTVRRICIENLNYAWKYKKETYNTIWPNFSPVLAHFGQIFRPPDFPKNFGTKITITREPHVVRRKLNPFWKLGKMSEKMIIKSNKLLKMTRLV